MTDSLLQEAPQSAETLLVDERASISDRLLASAVDLWIPVGAIVTAGWAVSALADVGHAATVTAVVAIASGLWCVVNSVARSRSVGCVVAGVRVARTDSQRIGLPRRIGRLCAHAVVTPLVIPDAVAMVRSGGTTTAVDAISRTTLRIDENQTRESRTRRTTVTLAMAPVISLLTLTVVVTSWSADKEQPLTDINSYLADRAQSIESLLSYSPDSVEAHAATVQETRTGQFLDYYSKYAQDTLVPQAQQKNLTAQWTVDNIGLTEARQDTATVLAQLSGTVTSPTTPAPEQLTSVVKVRFTNDKGTWKIELLEPV